MNKKLFHRWLLVMGLLILLGSVVFIAARWSVTPNVIAIHFDAAGQIDGWGKKSAVLILPILGAICYGLICSVSMLPTSLWNTPGHRPVRNAETARIMMALMGFFLALAFAYMTVCSVLCVPLGRLFLPAFIAGLALPFIGFLIFSLPSGKRK